MKKLAIISTHPIQYNAPLFRMLQERKQVQLKVFYTWEQSQKGNLFDPGFGIYREWDIPLLEGYDFSFVKNISSKPGSHHFWGIINPDLIKIVQVYNPDAILVYGWSFYSHLKVLFHFKNRVLILFRGDSTSIDDSSLSVFKKFIRNILLRWIYRHINKALYVGQANKEYFLANGLKEHQLIFAPHCIDNNRFKNENEYYEEQALLWRRELGIPDQSIVFLFAGKLEPKKNPLLLLNTFQNLSNENIRLIIVGNGVLEQELKEKAKSDPRIIFIDFQNQSRMPVVYRLGDVFILPSKGPGETWGLSVNEAMACGRPAIVSDACGCEKDLIIQGKTGYSFRSNNMSELKRSIQLFVEQHDKNGYRMFTQSHISRCNLEMVASAIENEIINQVKI